MVGANHQACAFAGHVRVGGQPVGEPCFPCGCSHSNCICDPGEEAGPCPPEAPLTAQSGDGGNDALVALFTFGFAFRMMRRK
jgi:hypothetical protein